MVFIRHVSVGFFSDCAMPSATLIEFYLSEFAPDGSPACAHRAWPAGRVDELIYRRFSLMSICRDCRCAMPDAATNRPNDVDDDTFLVSFGASGRLLPLCSRRFTRYEDAAILPRRSHLPPSPEAVSLAWHASSDACTIYAT